MLTQDILKQYVVYDPESGHFYSKGVKYSNKKEGERVGTLHSTKGYRYIVVKGKTYREQRVAFLYMTGEWPKHQVDHVNGIKDDNRWCNLRDVTPQANSANRGMWITNKSGYKGVAWNKAVSKWQVLCRFKGIQKYGGLFDDVNEAGKVSERIYMEMKKNNEEVVCK